MTAFGEQALLAWSSLPGVGPAAMLRVLELGRADPRRLEALWNGPVEDARSLARLPRQAAAALEAERQGRWRAAGEDLAVLREWGIDLLSPGDPRYPESLLPGFRGGPILYAYGALELLGEPRVALLNSRDASPAALDAAGALSDQLARRDVPQLASTHRAAYQLAAIAAKRHAAPVVLAMDRSFPDAFPHGVDRDPVAAARIWDSEFDPDTQLLLSPFGPRDRWTAGAPLRRDRLVADLADVLVAVEVREDGNLQRECLRALKRGRIVAALVCGGDPPPGTGALLEAGAKKLDGRSPEAAARAVAGLLPADPAIAAPERGTEGWRREIARFLVRAALALLPGHGPEAAIAGFPPGSAAAREAAAWSAGGSGPERRLVADLYWEGKGSPERVAGLIRRLPEGGILAMLAPASWLDGPALTAHRREWLQEGTLLAAARLPSPAWEAGDGEGCAGIFLRRGDRTTGSAVLFSPQSLRMGRFFLRRYLQEVLQGLAAGTGA